MAEKTAESSESKILSSSRADTARALWHRAAPWLAGAGIAVGHIAVSNNCTVPQQGRCGACGSCIVAIGSLVGWAVLKRRRGGEFFIDDRASYS